MRRGVLENRLLSLQLRTRPWHLGAHHGALLLVPFSPSVPGTCALVVWILHDVPGLLLDVLWLQIKTVRILFKKYYNSLTYPLVFVRDHLWEVACLKADLHCRLNCVAYV